MMQKIPLSQATEDMISAKNIRMPDGSFLLRAGDALDATNVRRLERTGVASVIIEGNPVEGYDIGYDAEYIVNRMPHLFRSFQDNPKMVQFSLLLQKILVERYK